MRRPGIKPVLVVCRTGHEQAAFVAQRVLELREEGATLDEMAVLYRSHFHALELQLELTRRNIPFSITSGIRFFEQAHLKDVSAYLKLVYNPRDELAFKRIAQLLPGIGGKGADKLWHLFLSARDMAGRHAPQAPPAATGPSERAAPSPAGAASAHRWRAACRPARGGPKEGGGRLGRSSRSPSPSWRPEPFASHRPKMIRLVIEAGYDEYLQETYTNYRSRLDDLEQLANFAQQFKRT